MCYLLAFFPQLVAGPIERSKNMLTQFNTKQVFDVQNIKNGLTLVLVGLVQKVVIADRLALYVNAVFANYQQASRAALIVAVVFFAFQVYCDFNAYSLIAIGSAKTMGYTLMRNFNHPYLSRSFCRILEPVAYFFVHMVSGLHFYPLCMDKPPKKIGQVFYSSSHGARFVAGVYCQRILAWSKLDFCSMGASPWGISYI